MLRVLLLLLLPLGLVGCLGTGGDPPARPAGPVQVQLALEPSPAGAPDGGTDRGHGADGAATATVRGERFLLRGSVQPAGSELRLLDGETGGQSAVARRRGAAFAFVIEHLRPGANRFVVEATHPGRAQWRQAVLIVRRAPRVDVPRSVVVPPRDPSPGEAELRLDRERLVAVATGRDAGGMARIRVSADLRVSCGAAGVAGLVLHDPPPQIGRVGVAPGTRVRGELRRRTDLRAAAQGRCGDAGGRLTGVDGVVWAEATNAHGLDRYSADMRFEH